MRSLAIIISLALLSTTANAGINCAIVDTSASPQIVTNVVEYDADITGQVPPAMNAPLQAVCVNLGRAGIGWTFVAGEFVDPVPLPPVVAQVPSSISAMQAKVALSRAGLLSNVQAWVNGQSAETQLIWTTAASFNRNSALINSAAAALGLTPAQVDALFATAAAINP